MAEPLLPVDEMVLFKILAATSDVPGYVKQVLHRQSGWLVLLSVPLRKRKMNKNDERWTGWLYFLKGTKISLAPSHTEICLFPLILPWGKALENFLKRKLRIQRTCVTYHYCSIYRCQPINGQNQQWPRRAFPVVAPTLWNSLAEEVRRVPTPLDFHTLCKTILEDGSPVQKASQS